MGASSVQLQTALTDVRSFLNEPTAQEWSDSQLTAYLNMGQADVQRKSEALRSSLVVPVTANVQRYAGPPDSLRIYRVEYIPTSTVPAILSSGVQTYSLEFRGFNEMDAIWGIYQQYTGAYPSLYTLWNQPPDLTIVTYPVPAEDGQLNVYYYPQPKAMVNQTDTLDCLPGFEDVIYDYAAYRALRQDADPRWKDQWTLYSENLSSMIDMSRLFTDQPNAFSSGSMNVPSWLVTGSDWW
jgi:hypothetical protein